MEDWEARMRRALTDTRLPLAVRADFMGALDCIDALRKDAERYRWLREQHTYDGEGDSDITRWYVQAGREPVPCDPGALDDEIDAAMAARIGAA